MTILLSVLGIFLMFVALYLYMVCPRLFHKPNISRLQGVHYAHRGLFDNETIAPENSLAAFRKAVKAGYGIEMDVQLSKDNVPVIFHDETLERMCGVKGNVCDYTLKELKKMKLAYSNETIPTFAEALRVVDGKVPLIIEYKIYGLGLKVCELGNAILEEYNGVYCIESFHPLAVRWYRKFRPDVVRGILSMNYWKKEEYRGKALYLLLTMLMMNVVARPDFIAYCHSDAGNVSRRLCRKLGALSVAWTIQSKEEYEKAKPHFDLFIFDSFILK